MQKWLLTKEKALESYNKIKQFLKGTIAEKSPVIPVSALQEVNLEKVLEELVIKKLLLLICWKERM